MHHQLQLLICNILWPQILTRRASAWLCRQRLEPTVKIPDSPKRELPGASSKGPSSGMWFTSGWKENELNLPTHYSLLDVTR